MLLSLCITHVLPSFSSHMILLWNDFFIEYFVLPNSIDPGSTLSYYIDIAMTNFSFINLSIIYVYIGSGDVI